MAQESSKLDMEETGCQSPEGPIHCANNCGFFGSKATMNMCSQCYKDTVLVKAKATSEKAALEKFSASIMPTPVVLDITNTADAQATSEKAALEKFSASIMPTPVVLDITNTEDAEAQLQAEATVDLPASKLVGQSNISVNVSQEASPSHSKNRCFSCNKRVGLTGFKCRCEDTFCSLHRYSDKHNCSFDYKAAGRDAIAKANPVVKADKVEKI